MKTLLTNPFLIYGGAVLFSLFVMLITDFIMGAEAHHLNAWAILTKLVGVDSGIPDSLAIQKLGLAGATLLMLALNTLFGVLLVQLVNFVHYLITL